MNTIKLKYGLEDITSRIPGLFAYLEFDENHVSTVHKATDSFVGCYGKIPCALEIPENISLVVDEENIIVSGKVYSYRTLMIVYYKYRNDYSDNSFIQFMERGIGKIETPFNEEWTLVPEYEYYANCARLFDEYTKIGKMCDKYQEIKEITGEINCELECLVDKYAKMGGNYMRDWYGEKAVEANGIADEYLEYVGNEFNLRYDINIVSKENDLGILNTYLEYYNPKTNYTDGMTTIYNDRTYLCVPDDYTEEYVQFPGNDAKFILLTEDYSQEEHHPENITGTTNSVLTGFRKNKNYLDEGGNIRLPQYGSDWLWYYRLGDVGYTETTTDFFNNIEILDGYQRDEHEGNYENHLMAYGDIINSITRDTDNKTITFEYIIGAHLKAELMSKPYTDDDDNKHYYYGDYEYDDTDSHGVLYTETYTYEEDGEIDLMSDDEFNDYITHDKVPFKNNNDEVVVNTYIKCAFNTWSNTTTNDMVVNGVPKE